jgi:hypothetical protein
VDLFRLPQPGSRPIAPVGGPTRVVDPLPAIPEQFNPRAQAEIRAVFAHATTVNHDGWLRTLILAPVGAAVLAVDLTLLPALGAAVGVVAIAEWLGRGEGRGPESASGRGTPPPAPILALPGAPEDFS